MAASTSSYESIYPSPLPVKTPYKPANALDDIPCAGYSLNLFLSSKMHEAEDYMTESDKTRQRLYFASAIGLVQCMKGVMSFADEDLLAALDHTKKCVLIASQHRKKAPYLTSRLAGYVVSSMNTSGVGWIKTMTDIERHAELIYAESLIEKAVIGIVYSGDWLALVKEALNLRTVIGIYRTLYKYISAVDAEYAASLPASTSASGKHIESPAIDAHFRSGVYLGAGLSSLIISLLPARLINFVEMFGYAADRAEALEILGRAGGWGGSTSKKLASSSELDLRDEDEDLPPQVSTAQEGVRRPLCDMALVVFHLVLGGFTFDCVDVPMAARIVNWNLKRYPDGVFFLFFAGLLAVVRSEPDRAIAYHLKAIAAQTQYRNLHHISYWEMAHANLARADANASLECWRVLEKEATWSKSTYTYGTAVCLLATAGDVEGRREEALKLMERVPTLRKKIAGKSLPIEKFVARKARKCLAQGGRLLLPALELGAVYFAIVRAPPRTVIEGRMLPAIRAELAALKEGMQGYWDDYCLARYMEGVCLRYVAFPNPDAVLDPEEVPQLARNEAAAAAKAAFESVFEHGEKIEFDHYVVYNAHFELGRLLARLGDETEARRHFELVLSGKYLEVGPSGRKGKYSLQNLLHVRADAALEAVHTKRL